MRFSVARRLVLPLFFSLATIAGVSAASAQAGWATYQDSDEGGHYGGSLYYGVPETDDTTFVATCAAGSPGEVDLTLYLAAFPATAGQSVTLTYGIGKAAAVPLPAIVGMSEEAGPDTTLTVADTDPLWTALHGTGSARFAIVGGGALTVSLDGSAAAVDQFFAICRQAWTATPVNPKAPIGGKTPALPPNPKAPGASPPPLVGKG